MINLESVYSKLDKIISNNLNIYIAWVNETHNDGFILSQLNRKESKQKPFYILNFEKAKYSEKEILIESKTYVFNIGIVLNQQDKDYNKRLWRYFEAFSKMIYANRKNEIWFDINDLEMTGCTIYFSVMIY